MTKQLKKNILELKKHLYPKNKETNSIDKINFQKALFKVLRECLKSREYEIEIGAYEFNVNPKFLSVKYESPHTTLEISNEDIYFETIRDIPTKFFIINNEVKNEYPMNEKVIIIYGMITNIDGIIEESYELELYTNIEDNIKNYIQLTNGLEIVAHEEENDYAISLKRRVNKNDTIINPKSLLKDSNIIPVYFDAPNKKYIKIEDVNNEENINTYLPTLEEKQDLVRYMYNEIVEFYKQYMNEIK